MCVAVQNYSVTALVIDRIYFISGWVIIMVDVVDKKTRSRMMSGIRGKNTRPELIVRKALFQMGYRYKIHDNTLPGKPDLVLPKFNAVILINGCFWHGHSCHLFKLPSTRTEFWKTKINRNRELDRKNYKLLKKEGWWILTIWECALKGKSRKPLDRIISDTAQWLEYGTRNKTIRGRMIT